MGKLLVFDYDGTIHETMHIYEPAFRASFAWLVENGHTGSQEIPSRQIASWLGMNSREMWSSFLPELPRELQEQASAMTGWGMAQRIRDGLAAWYPGAREALDGLKKEGFTLVVLSNCKVEYRKANWETFGMEQWFSDFYDCESYGFMPKTDIIREVEKKYGKVAAVFGDRKSDMDCARAAGAPFIGCTYGYGLPGELEGAEALAASVKELPVLALQVTAGQRE